MAVDPSLRAAVDGAFATSPDASAPEIERTQVGQLDALAEMRRLVSTTKDARVKAQLLKILREEERAAEAATEANPLTDLTDEEVRRIADEQTAATLRAVLTPGSKLGEQFPFTGEVVEKVLNRRVEERVAAELGNRRQRAPGNA